MATDTAHPVMCTTCRRPWACSCANGAAELAACLFVGRECDACALATLEAEDDAAHDPAGTVLAVAHAVLAEAVEDAFAGSWGLVQQRTDAVDRLLEAARMLPGRPSPEVGLTARPLLEWSRDADGWLICPEARAALRGGDRALLVAVRDVLR